MHLPESKIKSLAREEAEEIWNLIRLNELWGSLEKYLAQAYLLGYDDAKKALTKPPKRRKL